MKVLLCHPNQKVCLDGMKSRPMVGPPLGLLSVAAHLRSSGLPCEIGIFVLRSLTSPFGLFYNSRLVLKYPRAIVHAARNAISAGW